MEYMRFWIFVFIAATFALDTKYRWIAETDVCTSCLQALRDDRKHKLSVDQADNAGCLNWSDPKIVATHVHNGQLYHEALERRSASPAWLLRKTMGCVELDESSDGGRTYCLKRVDDDEPVEVTECGRSDDSSSVITDHRVSCRPPNDRMTWYRGEHSISVSGKRCIRWDSPTLTDLQLPVFSGWDFDRFENPGRDTPPTRVIDASAHENYCRNPDNSSGGPWCYTLATVLAPTVREPCFNVCVEYRAAEFCLSKDLFPWYLHWRNNKPEYMELERKNANLQRDVYRVTRERPKITGRPSSNDVHFHFYLNEFLSTPKLTQFDTNNQPKNAAFLTMDFLYFKTEYERVTRLTCFQTAEMTAIAGPWIYTRVHVHHKRFTDSHLFTAVRDASAVNFRDQNSLFAKNSRFRQSVLWNRRLGGHGLWRPCFLACQDVTVKCFPDEKFRYYGPANKSLSGQSCLPYYILYEWVMDDDDRFRDVKRRTPMIKFLRKLLSEDFFDKKQQLLIANGFARGRGFRMATNRCLNLGALLELNDEKLNRLSSFGSAEKFWVQQLKAIRAAGPGCFVDLNDYSFTEPTLDNVVFEPCFRKCKATDDSKPSYSRNPCQTSELSNSCLKLDQFQMTNSTTTFASSTTTATTTTSTAELPKLAKKHRNDWSSARIEWEVLTWPGIVLVVVVSVSAVGVLVSCLWGVRRGNQLAQTA